MFHVHDDCPNSNYHTRFDLLSLLASLPVPWAGFTSEVTTVITAKQASYTMTTRFEYLVRDEDISTVAWSPPWLRSEIGITFDNTITTNCKIATHLLTLRKAHESTFLHEVCHFPEQHTNTKACDSAPRLT